jgi:hypothetical protein
LPASITKASVEKRAYQCPPGAREMNMEEKIEDNWDL